MQALTQLWHGKPNGPVFHSDAAVTWQTSVPLFVIDEVDDTVDGGKDLRYEL